MEWIATIIFIFGFYLVIRYFTTDSRKRKPPGPKSYPIIGSALELDILRFHLQAYEYAKEFGDILEINIFNSQILLLNSVESISKAFCEETFKDIFNGRPTLFAAESLLGGLGIVASQPGKRHSDLRKALAKGFHIYGDGIARFEDIMNQEINNVMAKIEGFKGQEFEFVELTKRSICNVISILLIGQQATEEDSVNICELVTQVDYFSTPLPNTLMLKFPFLKYVHPFKMRLEKAEFAIKSILDKMFYEIKVNKSSNTVQCLVDYFIEEQQKDIGEGRIPILTDEVISSVILELFVAGNSSTTAGLSTAILFLINNPEYQTKIQVELDGILGSKREPCIKDKQDHHFNFLEAVILETLRHVPPAPLLVPHICTEDVNFDGYEIKKNTQVFANVFHAHHDDKVWEDPWVFRPERFLDGEGKLLPSSHDNMRSWLPFGTGRRKCPGLSLGMTRMFWYLSYFLQNWTFLPFQKNMSCDPRGEGFEYATSLKPKPFYCCARPRK